MAMEGLPPEVVVIAIPRESARAAPAEAARAGVLQRLVDRVVGLFSVCRVKYRRMTNSEKK
jgi:hypothetical protein